MANASRTNPFRWGNPGSTSHTGHLRAYSTLDHAQQCRCNVMQDVLSNPRHRHAQETVVQNMKLADASNNWLRTDAESVIGGRSSMGRAHPSTRAKSGVPNGSVTGPKGLGRRLTNLSKYGGTPLCVMGSMQRSSAFAHTVRLSVYRA